MSYLCNLEAGPASATKYNDRNFGLLGILFPAVPLRCILRPLRVSFSRSMRHNPTSKHGHAASQRTFPTFPSGKKPSTHSPVSGERGSAGAATAMTSMQSSPSQRGLQWPDQQQLSRVEPGPHQVPPSSHVWDQRYLVSGSYGTETSESPSRSTSKSIQSFSPVPHTFVPSYSPTKTQSPTQQSPEDELPPLKKRRFATGVSGTNVVPGAMRGFYSFNDRTRSTSVGSTGSMMITFPVESREPGSIHSYPASQSKGRWVTPSTSQPPHPAGLLPDDFEHGPTELPPRTYPRPAEQPALPGGSSVTLTRTKDSDKGKGKTSRRKPNLPDDVMNYLPTLEGRLCKIELGVRDYIEYRQQRAIEKSLLPPPPPRTHSDPGVARRPPPYPSTAPYRSLPSQSHASSSHVYDPDRQD